MKNLNANQHSSAMTRIKLTAVIAALFLIIGCGSNKPVPASSGVNTGGASRIAKSGGEDELDHAIREISDYLNKRIPKGTKVAFLNVKSDWPDFSEYILSCLSENAVNDEVFTVVDRQQLDAIRSELKFQWAGEVSDASAQEIGKMLGAQSIVSGNINTIGSIYRIQVRAIAVQTAALQGQFSKNVDSKSSIVTSLTKKVAPAGSAPVQSVASTGGAKTQTPAAPVAPAATAVTYKIGDTGPAGGLIFYVKGNSNGGWRYMEVAPVEAEFQAQWDAVNNLGLEGTQETIGSGKRNTQLIVDKFKQISGQWDTAAQKANDLVFNNFDDWFLPSMAELDQIYGNLKRKNLGNFKNERYWASSSTKGMAYSQNFENGVITDRNTSLRFYVRPIRQF